MKGSKQHLVVSLARFHLLTSKHVCLITVLDCKLLFFYLNSPYGDSVELNGLKEHLK